MRLAVNIDHIATVREARGGIEPDPVHAAVIAELAGAEGIVCHLREDRRHVNDRDVRVLREVVSTKLDLEMAATGEIIAFALDVLPDLVTIVPEKREELTTEGGLDVAANVRFYTDLVSAMHDKRIDVSYFIDPDLHQVEAAARCGANIIELHTGTYANSRSRAEAEAELTRLRLAAEAASEAGLIVTAGHGLDRRNIAPICRIPQIEEVSIGHALISRAMFVGMKGAVEEMLDTIATATRM
ncbi:MAG: pyridoxine 5'-phosphate synthase [Candidatus Kapabacteria bacterium]|nr:pyridoxine 5'-phosphate synthase [Candidatus Kapabacteria bacterium]